MRDWLQQSLHPLQPHNPDGGMDSLSETEQNKTKKIVIMQMSLKHTSTLNVKGNTHQILHTSVYVSKNKFNSKKKKKVPKAIEFCESYQISIVRLNLQYQ